MGWSGGVSVEPEPVQVVPPRGGGGGTHLMRRIDHITSPHTITGCRGGGGAGAAHLR